jgi:type IV secretion system protein VirB10
MRHLIAFALLAGACAAQEAPRLKSRNEVTEVEPPTQRAEKQIWVLPVGTKIPIQLRQPVSTKGAQRGDAIYAQTAFPIVIDGDLVVPAGTWVQGVVDSVKRAGRIKGTAELQFHLTTLIYANGYTVNMAAAVEQVPGGPGSSVKEPGTVKQDSEKGKDLERVGGAASTAGQIGAIAGVAANPDARGFGVGGLTGIAAGTLIALLSRGSDVRFETGTAVEIALQRAITIDPKRATRPVVPAAN